MLNVLENPILARVICPSQGWLTTTDASIGFQEIYCVTEAGLPVQGGCIEIDGRVWMGANMGYTYDNPYGGTYQLVSAQRNCPSGWSVPSKDELISLSKHYSAMTTFNGMRGRWISGSKRYSASVPAVFLSVLDRGSANGRYLSSTTFSSSDYDRIYVLELNDSGFSWLFFYDYLSFSVRCVKN